MRVLVTGASGFLGRALVRRLVKEGHAVNAYCRSDDDELRSITTLTRGDIADLQMLLSAGSGCDAVFHVAAMVGAGGRAADFERTNIQGTRHVIEACQTLSIDKLIYTSTPSVVHAGGDIEGADESLPYPTTFQADYPRTKAIAEQMVLAANSEQLATVALRPHLIWGPGDTNLVPRILARAKTGKLRFVGRTPKLVDTTYIDNAVDAHWNALCRLSTTSPCAGRAYFIANGEPVPQPDIINGILKAGGLPPCDKFISVGLAHAVGAVLEVLYRYLRPTAEPPMTRFLAEQLSTAHWYDLSAARRDLGYSPAVSVEQGLRRLADALSSRRPSPNRD